MEPPASNDPVKEACAPLADINNEGEVCHPVQQPQAHSVPHSSPPTGTAGIGPTSHSEEPLNEESREEVEEEMGHKVKKKHGESGLDSVACMDIEAERDQYEFLSSIHTCYHSSFFLLRTPVTVCGKPVEIRLYKGSPTLTHYHSEQECRVSLSAMSHIVAAVLRKHGVYHVDTFYYEQVPLFSVVFSSKANLKRFLTVASGWVKSELESVIGEEFTKQLASLSDDIRSNSHFDVSINIESYLVIPDRQEGTADVQLVTLANYSHYSAMWQSSRMFEFAHIFQAQLQRGIQKSLSSQKVDCAELKDLVNELQNVTDNWFRLGLNFDIPGKKLMDIKHDCKGVAECLLHMLIEWENREKPTWSKVIRALTAIGRTFLAQDLATKYGVDVPAEETALLPVAVERCGIAGDQTMMVPTVQTVDPQIEKQLKSKEEQLEASNTSRGVIKQDISDSTESLQQLQIQLRSIKKDREDIKVQLEEKKKKCEDFNRLKERYEKMWRKSREDIELLDEVIKEKEQEVKKLEGELEQKESEFQAHKQKLSEVQEDLSQKTSELQKKTHQVVGLERDVEQLKIKLSNKGKELDMEMQQMTAKASSQAAYIGEIKLHISSMREELETKEKEFDDYKERMIAKEEKIKQLTEIVHSQNIQKENQLRAVNVDGAHATADTVQNPDELAGTIIYVSKLTELDNANREKHQMMLKSEIASQEIKGLQESVRKLKSKSPDPSKCSAVGAGLQSAKKHQLSEFKVEVADVDGEPWTSNDGITITAEVTSRADEKIVTSNVDCETPAVYRVSYQPIKCGEHEINMKINGMPINGSPFSIIVHNNPDPNKCKVIGEQVESAQKNNPAKFMVKLADEEGDLCVTPQEVTVEVKCLMDGSTTKANVVSQTPATYEVSYQPSKSGEHELSVKVNSLHINGSPFALLVYNIPDPQNCKTLGIVKSAKKNENANFIVQLADEEGDPCVTKQEVTAELKTLADDSITKAIVVSQTPATYEVAYQPSKTGEHELSVKVNGIEINGNQCALLVSNIPDPQNCKAVGEGITRAEKHKTSEFIVHLADAEGDPYVTKQEVVVELKSLVDGSITKADVVSKTPATYAVSYRPSKSGEHELNVKVNGVHINGSPFALLAYNIPDPQNCKAVGIVTSAKKNESFNFIVQLADAEGDPCVTKQEVTAELKSHTDDSIIKANVVSQTPATYKIDYQPSKSGQHEFSVKVNGMEINGGPFALFIYTIPDPQNCKAVGEGIKRAEKHKTSEFVVQLADAEGDPCVTKQDVVVELKSLVDDSITKANVVSKTPATYAVSYQPSKSGEHELSVKVNDFHIEGSPFALFVVNMPHTKNCKAVGEHVYNAEKNRVARFFVQLADADGEPCATKQEVTIELKARANSSITEGSVVSKTPDTYEVSYQPRETGRYKLGVKVNGTHINGSPFALLVHNIPDPQNCEVVGQGITRAEKHKTFKFMVELADEEGDLCVTPQEVTAEVKCLMDGSIIKANVVSQTPATYEVSYQPSKSGEHELSVKVNSLHINGSPFALLVYNIPDPQNCKTLGIVKSAKKNENVNFIVQLADEEGDPCVTKQEVTAELKTLADDSITKAIVVSQTPATYEVAYQPSKTGEHELSVKVNGIEINGNQCALLVSNIPDPQNCKAVGEGITRAEKHKTSEFIVHLADAEGDPCVTKQEVVVELQSLVDGSITKADVVSKTPATYAVSYQPSKSGEHELNVKVNGVHINGSPFALLAYNIPDPQNCKAVGIVTSAKKNESFNFIVQLADAEGDPCVTKQEVTAELKSLTDDSIIKANVVSQTPATYKIDYQPSKSGQHEFSVKVNGMEINGGPFALFIYTIPDPQNCKAVGVGIKRAEKHKTSEFVVQLADAEGDPCVTKQDVVVELKSLVDDSITKANVVSKTPATYAVSYQPSKSGEHELSVKVNDIHIEGSPFAQLVVNIPHTENCKAIGEHVKNAEKNKAAKFLVQLADADGEPCATKQEVTVELKARANGSITEGSVVSKTPDTYEVSYQPRRSGRHELSVKMNGMYIKGSPFALFVHNIPDLQNCKAVGEGITKAEKHKTFKFMVQLADAEGDPCVTKQDVVVGLKSLVDDSITKANVVSKTPATYAVSYRPSKSGEHELSVKVNDFHIEGSPFALFVVNMPHTKNCKAVGEHVYNAEKNKSAKFFVQLADEDCEPCATKQDVTVELKTRVFGSITEGSVVSKTPDTYEVSYQPRETGRHKLGVKVNGTHISGSPFALLVHNIPDPQNCKAVGEGLKRAEILKRKTVKFMVQLADAEGDPCVTKQEVVVEIKSLVDGSITKADVVSKTPATYAVSYQPSKSGEHEVIVKLNGTEINGSPFALLVHDTPDPQSCKAVGEGIKRAEKRKTSEFMVQLADAEGDPCVTEQEVVVELKSLVDGSITKANMVRKTPATYSVSYRPGKSGEHELSMKVNGVHINGSPFAVLVYNIPDPQNCKTIGIVRRAKKNESYNFIVQLADEEGDPCATKQEVTAELKSLADGSITTANVVSQTPATYEVDYHSIKSGEHQLSVKVNGMEINGSPFKLLVYNIPDPQNCKAVREGITIAEKHKISEFMVQLADAEGDPCVTEQDVVVELKSLVDDSITKANVVRKTPATYSVSYQPSKSGEHELSVKVNDIHVEGSPFALFVVNILHTENCKAIGEHVKTAEKNKVARFMIQLADEDGEPCATKQEVTIELKALLNGSITEGSVVSRTPATYEASYQPRISGRHELSAKVNGMPIKGSPFAISVHNKPHPKKCKAIGEQIESALKNNPAKFIVQLADEDGDPCVTTQEVTAELKSLMDGSITNAAIVSQTPATYEVAYQPRRSGRHELSAKVNGMPIKGSPFAISVHNKPHPKKCKAIGEQIESALKNNPAKFIVQLADEDGDPCVTIQEVTAELKSLMDGSITNAAIVSQTPATYEVAYQPSKSGEHEVIVKVNGMEINGSPFVLLVYNIPDPQNCTAVGIVKKAKILKRNAFKFNVELADADGEPCVIRHDVTAQLISADDYHYSFNASVTHVNKNIYEVSYRPRKSAEYKLIVKVNGREINSSPFDLLVYNTPHLQNCKVKRIYAPCQHISGLVNPVTGHMRMFEQPKTHHSIIVELADKDGEPCITTQKVTATMNCTDSLYHCKVHSLDPATYRVDEPEQCPIEISKLTVHVNGMTIQSQGSPLHTNRQWSSGFSVQTSVEASKPKSKKKLRASTTSPEPAVTSTGPYTSYPFTRQGLPPHTSPAWTTAASRSSSQTSMEASKPKPIASTTSPEPAVTTTGPYTSYPFTSQGLPPRISRRTQTSMEASKPKPIASTTSPELVVTTTGPYTSNPFTSQGLPPRISRRTQTSMEASKPKPRASTTSPELVVTTTGPYTSNPFTSQGLPPHISRRAQTSMEASKPKPIVSTTSPELVVTTTGPYTSNPFTSQGLPPHISRRAQTSMEASKPKPIASTTSPELVASHYYRALHQQPLHQARTSPSHQPQSLDHDHSRWTTAASSLVHRLQ